MKNSVFANGAGVVLLALSVSCSEDPELIEKRNAQQAEIARLQGEVALAQEKLQNLPEDKTQDLKAAEKQLDELVSEAEKLDSDVTELQEQKASLEKKIAEYKEKYPLN